VNGVEKYRFKLEFQRLQMLFDADLLKNLLVQLKEGLSGTR
jgi:hypothetical protein